MKKLKDIVDEVLQLSAEQNKFSGFCIGNTRKIASTGMYFTPVRSSSALIAGSAIVYRVTQAIEIAEFVDGKVDYILVDTEKKISSSLYAQDIGNIERAVRENTKISKVITFNGNDLTVNSLDLFLEYGLEGLPLGLGGKSVSIIGAGNIGSKLALKLVERGMSVTLCRRDEAKLNSIVKALNIIKPNETVAMVKGTINASVAARDADVVIGLTPGIPVINSEIVGNLNNSSIIIDAGKGCLTKQGIILARERKIPIYRAEIRSGFEGSITSALVMEKIVNLMTGRREIDGIKVVSGGLLGHLGEIVVDNVNNPSIAFGVADGNGDFIRNLECEDQTRLDKISLLIKKR